MLHEDCSHCPVHRHCVSMHIQSEGKRAKFNATRVQRVVQVRKKIWSVNDTLSELIIVKSGAIKMHHSQLTNPSIGRIYLPGDIVGLEYLHTPAVLSEFSTSKSASYCSLPLDSFNETLMADARFGREIFKRITQQIQIARLKVQFLQSYSSQKKVASFLIYFSERQKQLGFSSDAFQMPLNRGEVAGLLCMTSETLIRVLSKFQKAGIVRFEKHHHRFCIQNRHELKAIAA